MCAIAGVTGHWHPELSAQVPGRVQATLTPLDLRSSDGVVAIRAFQDADRDVVIAGRDAEWDRWLGPGSSEPSPTASIEVDGAVVGWVDADPEPPWLRRREVNVGYNVFEAHRGHGYASRAVRLLLSELARTGVTRALLVIDPDNAASLRVAVAVGGRVLRNRQYPDNRDAVVYAV
jgi:RimJ/RimL family protein N-acetyltransferase